MRPKNCICMPRWRTVILIVGYFCLKHPPFNEGRAQSSHLGRVRGCAGLFVPLDVVDSLWTFMHHVSPFIRLFCCGAGHSIALDTLFHRMARREKV